jgi:hypothetical protein
MSTEPSAFLRISLSRESRVGRVRLRKRADVSSLIADPLRGRIELREKGEGDQPYREPSLLLAPLIFVAPAASNTFWSPQRPSFSSTEIRVLFTDVKNGVQVNVKSHSRFAADRVDIVP